MLILGFATAANAATSYDLIVENHIQGSVSFNDVGSLNSNTGSTSPSVYHSRIAANENADFSLELDSDKRFSLITNAALTDEFGQSVDVCRIDAEASGFSEKLHVGTINLTNRYHCAIKRSNKHKVTVTIEAGQAERSSTKAELRIKNRTDHTKLHLEPVFLMFTQTNRVLEDLEIKSGGEKKVRLTFRNIPGEMSEDEFSEVEPGVVMMVSAEEDSGNEYLLCSVGFSWDGYMEHDSKNLSSFMEPMLNSPYTCELKGKKGDYKLTVRDKS